MIPKYNEMYTEVLQILNEEKEIRLKELVRKVSDELNLSIEDRNQLTYNGQPLIYYRLGWTKTYLAKAGLLETVRRGLYRITEEGMRVASAKQFVTNEFLMKYPSFVEYFKPKSGSRDVTCDEINLTNHDSGSTPNESIDQALHLINARLRSELLETILSRSPYYFGKLVLDLLDKMGYAYDKESIIRTAYTNDEGIDGIIKEDGFGFNSIYIQAKRWTGIVGRPEIQKFLGAVAGQGGSKGLFITTSKFTEEAMNFADKQLQVKLILINGEKLSDLMLKYGLGVSVVKTYELKQIDIDYFEDSY